MNCLSDLAQADDLVRDVFLKALRQGEGLQRACQRLKARMTLACQVQLDAGGHVSDFVPRR